MFFVFGPCCVIQYYVLSSFAIIPLGKRQLVALLILSSGCHVAVWFFASCSRYRGLGLWCLIVEFSDHTHLYFFINFKL